MKKAVPFLTAIALFCSTAPCFAVPVNALEATTMVEYNQQMAEKMESAFPDTDLAHQSVTEGDFVFDVYDAYAVLTECTNQAVTEVTIPAKVQGVPVRGSTGWPFGFCRDLTTIILPDTMEHFEWFDFTTTTVTSDQSDDSEEMLYPSVSSVVVSETNPYFTVEKGLLYSKDKKTLIGCPPALGRQAVSLPEETETINDYAFAACIGLERAIIPRTVKHIHNSAFVACINLKCVELPSSITTISGDLFYYCTSLEQVIFQGKIEKIGFGAFGECTALKEFYIPPTVTSIGSKAFENTGCVENVDGVHYVQNWVVGSDEDIDRVELRAGTIGIAEMAFFVRNKLSVLQIPKSVTSVGDFCFAGLSSGETPATIHYASASIGERTLASAKTATDLYIYDADCAIFDSEKTIPATYQYTLSQADLPIEEEPLTTTISTSNRVAQSFSSPEAKLDVGTASDDISVNTSNYATGNIVIHGYANSTAQAYAEKYNRTFEPMERKALPGDVNGDETFDIADAELLQKWLLAVPDTEPFDLQAADMNHDGRLNAFDLSLLKQELLAEKQAQPHCTLAVTTNYGGYGIDGQDLGHGTFTDTFTVYPGDVFYEAYNGHWTTSGPDLKYYDVIVKVERMDETGVTLTYQHYVDDIGSPETITVRIPYGEQRDVLSTIHVDDGINYQHSIVCSDYGPQIWDN